MKRRTFFFSLISICLAAPVTAFGQKGCESDGEPHRHFLVLAGRSGTFYDNSGPAFPMLIKLDGERTQVDSVGVFSIQGKRMFGPVPAEAYQEFMKEPRAASDVMLRLELTEAEFERSHNVFETWNEYARTAKLPHNDPYLNGMEFMKSAAENLNQCDEKLKLHTTDGVTVAQNPHQRTLERRRMSQQAVKRGAPFNHRAVQVRHTHYGRYIFQKRGKVYQISLRFQHGPQHHLFHKVMTIWMSKLF